MPNDTPGPGPCPKCGSPPIRWGSLLVEWSCGAFKRADGTGSHGKECHKRRLALDDVLGGEPVDPEKVDTDVWPLQLPGKDEGPQGADGMPAEQA